MSQDNDQPYGGGAAQWPAPGQSIDANPTAGTVGHQGLPNPGYRHFVNADGSSGFEPAPLPAQQLPPFHDATDELMYGIIAKEPSITTTALAQRMNISRSTASERRSRLKAQGYIQR